ncbi:MAG: methyltransferase [Bacteroidales bacterium]
MEFKFKKFTVQQAHSAMRVNTDGVLLGAWMRLPQVLVDLSQDKTARMLDVGTGTGVIALMAAQRVSQIQNGRITVIINALEIDLESYKEAVKNFANSPWGSGTGSITLKAEYHSLQQYALVIAPTLLANNKYDLIFSNPPYFIDSLKSPVEAKSNARHTTTLSQSEIIRYSTMLLKEEGTLAIVLPADEGEQFLCKINFLLAAACNNKLDFNPVLVPVRLCKVRTTANKMPKRYLIEFKLTVAINPLPVCVEEELIIMENGNYTLQYKELTCNFYLNF